MYCDLHTHTKHTVLLGAVSWLLNFFMLWLKESVMHSSETTLVLSSSGISLTNHILEKPQENTDFPEISTHPAKISICISEVNYDIESLS